MRSPGGRSWSLIVTWSSEQSTSMSGFSIDLLGMDTAARDGLLVRLARSSRGLWLSVRKGTASIHELTT